jgi:hypothetical protein
MKKIYLFAALFAAGFAVSSCSSENDANNQDNGSIVSKFDVNGNAYVNFAINMPAGSATRANEDYDHGTAAEYEVHDAVLLLFNGASASEGSATFVSASNMNNKVATGPQTARVSDRILFTQQINKGHANLAGSTGLLAFLVVNHNGKFVVADDHSLKINGTAFTGTFGELKALQLSELGNTTNGLLMTNSPMSSKPGKTASPAGANITYLTEINAADIYNSESDAYNGSRFIDIFVERAAAKVNVTSTATGTLIDGTVTYSDDELKWNIENYNTNYYVERHISNSYFGSTSANLATTNYRFVDSQPVYTGFTLYRTYWAEDHNMDGVPDNTTTSAGSQPDMTSWNGLSSVQYIAENTVDQNSLKQEYTTRLVLAVPFNNGVDFYTSSFTGADVIKSTTDMVTATVDFIKTLPSYATWKATNSGFEVTGVTFSNAANGLASVETITTSGGSNADAIKTEVNGKAQFSFYKGGMAYYKVLIKHFGDDETPLAATVSGTGYNDIYGSVEADRINNFLGRYSIVRNNWYNVNLEGIRHIGKPSVPEIPTDTPDDEIDAYLKVRINVLSWGMRTQNVTL